MTTEARALARRIVAEVFDASPAAPLPESVASSEAQLAGRRIVAEILAEQPPEAPVEDTEPAPTEEPADAAEPGGPEVAARMVAEVLARSPAVEPPLPPPRREDRVELPEAGPPLPPDPSITQRLEEDPPARPGRWILVTIGAAIALAVLFPLAIRALLELLSLS